MAIVTSHLAAALRERAELASEREREARLLHDLAALLATRPLREALEGIAERIRGLGFDAVSVELDEPPMRTVTVGNVALVRDARAARGAEDVLGPARLDDASASTQVGRWRRVARPHAPGAQPTPRVRRIPIPRSDGQAAGALLLVLEAREGDLPERPTQLLATVAGQIGIAAEQDALRRASTEAEVLRRTDELRGRLLDAVSHDLRTPLASIIAASGSLQQTDVAWSDEDRRDFAAAIEQEATRLIGSSATCSTSAVSRTGRVPHRDWQDPAVVLGDAIDRLRSVLPGRTIELNLPDDLPAVLLDAVEIDQVVANLVENAANVSPPDKPIAVSARIEEGELLVLVEDRGPGLPVGLGYRLFEPFVRGMTARSRLGAGWGWRSHAAS